MKKFGALLATAILVLGLVGPAVGNDRFAPVVQKNKLAKVKTLALLSLSGTNYAGPVWPDGSNIYTRSRKWIAYPQLAAIDSLEEALVKHLADDGVQTVPLGQSQALINEQYWDVFVEAMAAMQKPPPTPELIATFKVRFRDMATQMDKLELANRAREKVDLPRSFDGNEVTSLTTLSGTWTIPSTHTFLIPWSTGKTPDGKILVEAPRGKRLDDEKLAQHYRPKYGDLIKQTFGHLAAKLNADAAAIVTLDTAFRRKDHGLFAIFGDQSFHALALINIALIDRDGNLIYEDVALGACPTGITEFTDANIQKDLATATENAAASFGAHLKAALT